MNSQTFKDKMPRLILGENSKEINHRYRSHHQLQSDILKLAQLADISKMEPFPIYPRRYGKLFQMVKNLGNRLFSPIVRLYLSKQIKVNEVVISLAAKVAALEARILELESRTQNHGERHE